MNKLTIALIYYNNPSVLPHHINRWRLYSSTIKNRIKIVLVDDGSNKKAESIIKNHNSGIDVSLYEILQDIPWNDGGAANLSMLVSTTPWVLRMDIDHLVPEQTILNILNTTTLCFNTYYTLKSIYYNRKDQPSIHPSQILYPRYLFWKAGGYDEDFSGNYGSDDIWLKHRLDKIGNHKYRDDLIIEAIFGASDEHGLNRDTTINKQLLNNKKSNKIPFNDEIIRFPWRKVDL